MNIVFMGTPDFAKDSLQALTQAKHNILAVVTNPDKQQGRGMKLTYTPVKQYALEQGYSIYQPEKIKNNTEFIQKIKELNPDIICVVAYGKILPKEILEIPKLGCINVHGSLLPQYRGAAPIQWAVLNGDKETGITTMYMNEGMDTGDMILKQKVSIGEDETTGELWERLSKIGAKLLVETLEQIEQKIAPRQPQGENFTLAPMLKKEMANINWKEQTAQEIKNLVRGLNPIMGAYTFYQQKKLKFWKVQVMQDIDTQAKPGQIIKADSKDGLWIKAKQEIIKVEEIQGENAKRMQILDYLRGNTLCIGEILK